MNRRWTWSALATLTRALPAALRSAIVRALVRGHTATPSNDAAEPAGLPSRSLRILVTEDNVINQQLARSLLERRGHTVEIAPNGYAALEALDKAAFDVVLMDLQMPGMDGLEATAVIRTRERSSGSRIPIIAMTARGMPGDREECLSAGMDGYLSKPVRPEELYATIEKLSVGHSNGNGSDNGASRGLDKEELNVLTGHHDVLIHQLLRVFIAHTPSMMAELDAALRANDVAAVQNRGHALKGMFSAIAATGASACAARIETLARGASLAGVEAVRQELELEVAQAMADARGILGER